MGPDLALAIHTSSPDLAMALAPFPWSGDGPLSLSCKATEQAWPMCCIRNCRPSCQCTNGVGWRPWRWPLDPGASRSRRARFHSDGSVATGPGGFTGNRLGVVLARTMARNLQIPLFGCGSFVLMAQHLLQEHPEGCTIQLEQTLRKRGWIRGRYRITADGSVEERQAPQLLTTAMAPGKDAPWLRHPALVEPATDVVELLRVLMERHALGDPGHWQGVLPLYPAAAVEHP